MPPFIKIKDQTDMSIILSTSSLLISRPFLTAPSYSLPFRLSPKIKLPMRTIVDASSIAI